MTRMGRIALELLGPPLLGAGLLWSSLQMGLRVSSYQPASLGISDLFITILFFSFLAGALPTVIYAAVMERSFARGLNPNSWRTVGLSSLLGLAAGAIIYLPRGHFIDYAIGPLFFLLSLGAAVGVMLGLFIKVCPQTVLFPEGMPLAKKV